ncbi:hypothetical protein PYJP_06640 [Pyrofollis japonicus]|nr:hypothetical protein PYJP_06640 [Pyrofollis japonicus]
MLRGVSGEWCLGECLGWVRRSGYRRLYRGLVVSAALGAVDRFLVSVAVVLSRRTRYATNVRRWMHILFNGINAIDEDSLRLVAERAARLPSPQPRTLARLVKDLWRLASWEGDAWELRRQLLGLPGVGPKTADAILLFTGRTTWVAPSDTNLARFAREVLGLEVRPPQKSTCLCYDPACPRCAIRGSCLSGTIVGRYGGAAGLVQTEAYLYNHVGAGPRWREELRKRLEKHYS